MPTQNSPISQADRGTLSEPRTIPEWGKIVGISGTLVLKVQKQALRTLAHIRPNADYYEINQSIQSAEGRHTRIEGDKLALSSELVSAMMDIVREQSQKLTRGEYLNMTEFFTGEAELNIPDQRTLWNSMRTQDSSLFYRVDKTALLPVYGLRKNKLAEARALYKTLKTEFLEKKERLKQFVKPITRVTGGDGLISWGEEDIGGIEIPNRRNYTY